jgi:hypothetical protein
MLNVAVSAEKVLKKMHKKTNGALVLIKSDNKDIEPTLEINEIEKLYWARMEDLKQ